MSLRRADHREFHLQDTVISAALLGPWHTTPFIRSRFGIAQRNLNHYRGPLAGCPSQPWESLTFEHHRFAWVSVPISRALGRTISPEPVARP